MNEAPADVAARREALRQRFLGHCGAAFDLMFHPEYQDQLVTFDQREERAVELGRDLITWLLQQHANAGAQARPGGQPPPACPKCGRPGGRLTEPDQPLPQRQVATQAGQVASNRGRWRCTTCRVVFSPPGQELRLGTEGPSPAVLRLLVRQAGKSASFKEASEGVREPARIAISPHHLGTLAGRVGRDWAAARDRDVQAFQKDERAATHAQPPQVATVMVDGGRAQTRAGDGAPGVTNPGRHEAKVACCQALSSPVHAADPQPQPPSRFLDPIQAARLAAGMKSRSRPARSRARMAAPPPPQGQQGHQEAAAGEAGANGGGEPGPQRNLRLAHGGRGATARLGAGAA
jgi:hypothetical protein